MSTKKIYIVVILIILTISGFLIYMYPFVKGIIEDIPKNQVKRDSIEKGVFIINKDSLNNLIGYWAESTEDDVSFSFNKEGVIKYFGYDDGYIYNYVVKEDVLIIKEGNHIISKYDIVKINSDSLNLKTETGEQIKYYKRKVENVKN